MENIKKLLEEVAKISNEYAEELDKTGERFNMFGICGVDHYENTHTKIIKEFLDPLGSHGLKHRLLKCFVETVGISDFNCENASVSHQTKISPRSQLDILIEDEQKKYAIIVENKIYDEGNHEEQLKKYAEDAAKNYQKHYLFYLTLDGKDAFEQNKENEFYMSISHEKTMINWLEKCIVITEHHPIVRETIKQYINHLKQLTNQDMDTKNKEEIHNAICNNLLYAEKVYTEYFNAIENLSYKFKEDVKKKLLSRKVISNETVIEMTEPNAKYSSIWIQTKFKETIGIENFNGNGHENGNLFIGLLDFNRSKREEKYKHTFWIGVTIETIWTKKELFEKLQNYANSDEKGKDSIIYELVLRIDDYIKNIYHFLS